ncbi:TetR/AcrR family transcriptional regulator [Nocardia beijingensis]|uniref:TetR/AcrR family transcriptional regulator n=1 Tax=Nocardia beijingensis TaxID=95162 RepID=UPI002B4AB6DD|nr:TetR/AcrR family transcriptional regulator [Nocardia beijingensis]
MTRAAPVPRTSADNGPDSGFRRRLLDAMAAAVRERGYQDTTVADVVRHARTSRRTFYEHFTSKQDCFIALLSEHHKDMIQRIDAAVDPHMPWRAQVRQAIEAWIHTAQLEPSLTLSWIRVVPALGDDSRQLQREVGEAFVTLIQKLADTPEFAAAGLRPPSRQVATILFGGFRELIATTVEDGDDIAGIIDVAAESAIGLIGPHR